MRLSARFDEALLYATRLHADQTRKASGVPYVAHLLEVAAIVLQHGGSEDEAIAALLHDAVEDQGGAATRDEIERRFGKHVAEIVDGCTDTDVTPKPAWRERKEKHLAQLCHASPSVCLVAAADKLANARSLVKELSEQGNDLWQAFRGGREGTLWYYQSALVTLEPSVPAALATELRQKVEELVQLADPRGN